MPIERGADWGWPPKTPGPWPTCSTDAELTDAIAERIDVVQLAGGDIARTLGVAAGGAHRSPAWQAPLDALRVWIDDREPVIAAAHVRIGSWTSRQPWHAIMNAAFVGDQNLAPRAHPGDGVADFVTMELPVGDRLKARRRVRTGTHVPHPGIAIRRASEQALTFATQRPVRLDYQPPIKARAVRVEVVSQAIIATF